MSRHVSRVERRTTARFWESGCLKASRIEDNSDSSCFAQQVPNVCADIYLPRIKNVEKDFSSDEINPKTVDAALRKHLSRCSGEWLLQKNSERGLVV